MIIGLVIYSLLILLVGIGWFVLFMMSVFMFGSGRLMEFFFCLLVMGLMCVIGLVLVRLYFLIRLVFWVILWKVWVVFCIRGVELLIYVWMVVRLCVVVLGWLLMVL